MRRQLVPALRMVIVLTVALGIVFPLAMTGVAQALFSDKANGSIVKDADGREVGSSLLGQSFTEARFFHPRPSAAGDGYDGASSSSSNLGPTNQVLLAAVRGRVDAYREENGLSADTKVPVDAVTASGSGLDPQISVANARLQAARVAEANALSVKEVDDLIGDHTQGRSLGFLGEPGVNVLELNLALERG